MRLRLSEQHNEIAGALFSMVGVLYAIVLAFVVFAVWEWFSNSDEAVTAEATAAVLVFRDAQALPEPLRQEAYDALRYYLTEGVACEWEGSGTREVRSHVQPDPMNPIWEVYRRLQPTTPLDIQRHTQAEINLTDLARLRHLASEQSLEDIFWAVLIVGAILTIGFSYLFHMENFRLQAVMTGLMALLLFLIAALNEPFTGPVRVSKGAYEHAIEMSNAQMLGTTRATQASPAGMTPDRDS